MKKTKLLLSILMITITFSLLSLPVEAAKRGTGQLSAYDSTMNLLPTDDSAGGNGFSCSTGQKIYIKITGITEFNPGNNINIIVKWGAGGINFVIPGTVQSDGSITVMWVVGDTDNDGTWESPEDVDIPYCNTMPIDYGVTGKYYNAASMFSTGPPQGHLHAVPEYLYGGLAAIGACFGGFVIFKKYSSLKR